MATARFIELHDALFDILNSKSPSAPGFKGSLSPKTVNHAFEVFKEIRLLYRILTDSSGIKLIHSRRRCAFLGFLTAIDAAERLYKYIETGTLNLNYLSTYKYIQDHLEIFFNGVRLRNGWSINPTPRQFRSAFRQLTVHAGKNILGSLSANCIAQDETAVLLIHSSNIMTTYLDISNIQQQVQKKLTVFCF